MWIEPHLDDFLDHPIKTNRKPRTNKLFGSVETFLQDLKKLYSGVDELKKAERQMHSLKQTRAVTTYTAKFQQIAGRLE